MYIQITIDLHNYNGDVFDLRLSNYLPVKKAAEIAWQLKGIKDEPREGCWVRIVNKEKVCPGDWTLQESGITTGDRLEIL
ncbi:ubiquitin [Bacillus aerolatus]|uniref:Ubiquitin n=1 Tax=Bacillus aerolatus TaxID=2653354 RepID=A0A6I1FMM2_9BACI|nr:EsaB/YukD family protein [Bacillus aerolatus]KAB7708253.1 ubiquitin [Bacillus aerolatus]